MAVKRLITKNARRHSSALASAALAVACCAGCSSTDTASTMTPSMTSGPQSSYAQNIAHQQNESTWSKVKNFVVGTGSPETPQPKEQPLAPELSLATAANPSPNLSTRLAQVAEQSGNRNGAIENYRRALQQDPRHLDAVMGLARLYDRDGDFATATTLYLQAVAIEPGNASVQNDLGLCFARQSRFEEAETALQKAVTTEPEGQLYRNNLATVQVELRKYDAALQNLRAAHPPEIAEYNLGYLLSQKQDFDQARAHFQSALQLKPQFPEAEAALAALGGPAAPAAQGPRLGDRYGDYQPGQGYPQQ